MITAGVVLLILGLLLGSSVLWSLGVLLVVLGLIFWILGRLGHALFGRKHFY